MSPKKPAGNVILKILIKTADSFSFSFFWTTRARYSILLINSFISSGLVSCKYQNLHINRLLATHLVLRCEQFIIIFTMCTIIVTFGLMDSNVRCWNNKLTIFFIARMVFNEMGKKYFFLFRDKHELECEGIEISVCGL